MLIDEHGDALPCLKRSHHAPNRALTVDHGIAGALPHLLEQLIEIGVVERTGQQPDRFDLKRVHHRVQLPESKVAGDEQDAFALCVGESRALFPVEFDTRQHLLARQRAELEQLEQQTAEMGERRTRDDPAFGRRTRRKGGRQVALGDPPVRTIDRIKRNPERRSARAHDRVRHHADEGDERPYDQVLETVSHTLRCEAGGTECGVRGAG